MSVERPCFCSSWMFLAVLFLVLLWAPLLRPNGMLEGPGNPKNGRDLFVKKGCIRCHSIWNSDGKRGPSLASVGMGRNLYELCASVWSHWSQMNALMERDREKRIALAPSEFKDLVAYLYYLNYNAEPGDPVLGESIFARKHCKQCHAVEPLQNKRMPGRPVYEMREFQGGVNLAVAVWNHGTDMYRSMSGQRIDWPEFQEKEVTHLVAFIRSRSGAARESEMVLPGDPSLGRLIFSTKSCATCHRPGADPTRRGTNLASSGAAASLSSLIASLWNHYPKMFQTIASSDVLYPKISREEMENLLAYVYWMKAFGLGGNASAGRKLYENKRCASCHSPARGKPPLAANLEKSESTKSVYALLSAIWNHGPKMEALLRERNISWPSMTGEEMRDLVAFFRRGQPEGLQVRQ